MDTDDFVDDADSSSASGADDRRRAAALGAPLHICPSFLCSFFRLQFSASLRQTLACETRRTLITELFVAPPGVENPPPQPRRVFAFFVPDRRMSIKQGKEKTVSVTISSMHVRPLPDLFLACPPFDLYTLSCGLVSSCINEKKKQKKTRRQKAQKMQRLLWCTKTLTFSSSPFVPRCHL